MTISVNNMLIKMIKSIDIFQDIPDDKIIELSKSFNLVFHPSGKRIITKGTKLDKIYILKNGTLEVRKQKGVGNNVLGEIKVGEIFGEMSYIKNQEAMANVITTSEANIREIDVEDFTVFLKKYPNIMDKVYVTMKERDKQNSYQKTDEDIYTNIIL
ncbi:cyclic nucleotide-binding domain-containing protein [Candidatus Vampirococcus lugosii]|uniref:Cyclic nucleotide-binding protein n=1 Tax=Candidatus Vampirococcus lugosii TaxID=2789015 RepID=A0ABS5QJR3_9BACT|nr:cyclic nucleotide-binding domain-containing protein [Candidatus Vampirococcus lugosii]MBS8121458.1 Cyclic nucleotide-binding protein [Candidatus Vampirococcus lugosii]